MQLQPLKRDVLPEPPKSVWKLLGPSFILLGLGLGTGELILWPFLVSNWGLGIMWGAVLGITIQYFLNMEIERYTLVNGESIFVGFARIFRFLPMWFIGSTVIAWSWPAFSSASAAIFSQFGIVHTEYIAVGMLILVGLILTLGPVLYKTVETVEKVLICIAIPLIIIIAALVIDIFDIRTLLLGILGVGEGYYFVPLDTDSGKVFPYMAFLAAFAYSGAGGNLLLAQSFYIKEKGYGMGKYSGKITSLITGKAEEIHLEGTTYNVTEDEKRKFKSWFAIAGKEHFIVFWGMGLLTMLLLGTISYASVYGNPSNAEGINFVFNQAKAINAMSGGILGTLLLIVTSLMLFSTQLSVIDGAGRIVAENVALVAREKIGPKKMPYVYYAAIWIILIFGMMMLLVGVKEPQFLIVTGAVINAVCMTVFAGLLNRTNSRLLHHSAQASDFRKAIITAIFVILLVFTSLVLIDKIF